MRSHLHVAVLCVALLSLTGTAHAARSLQQEGVALSNSDGCLPTIPKCESGACATRNVMGVARWVCLRCLGGYEPVVTADGQDNIIQCVCPRGTFEDPFSGCARCPANQFCPGGDKVENPTSRGTNSSCGSNLVTRNTGARTQADCVAPAGYARTSPTSATPCGLSEYAPQFNRLSKCLRCQSGLEEQPNSNLTDGARATKRAVCKIPPGRFMSQGLVRICPQGFYRVNWLNFDDPLGTLCTPCRPGITTAGAGKGLASDCNIVLEGYGISEVDTFNGTAPAALPAIVPAADGGYPDASLCNLGFYSKAGQCVGCPFNTVTLSRGAKSIEECVVPPGYFIPTNGAVQSDMQQCAAGSFRENFVMYSADAAKACTPCGSGIDSIPRDLDQNPLAVNGSLVRGTAASCFITAGQGMIAQGQNTFTAQDCPINTYGAAGLVYGWAAAPCKPCPRNMITDGQIKVNNSEVCVNDDGFGYASEGASRCAPGFYSAKGSRKPCQRCPSGRTTADNPLQQRLITDCLVRPGSGVANVAMNGTDALNINVTALNSTQRANLPVLECPVGYYGPGNSTSSKCVPCPAGSSTMEPGSTSAAACSVCIPGFGKATPNAPFCSICPPGQYQPGGLTTCQPCANATFYPPVDGSGDRWTSTGLTTFPGAVGPEFCVTKESQLSPEAGQAYFDKSPESPLVQQQMLTNSSRASLGACMASCPADSCCLAEYNTASKVCLTAAFAPVGTGSGDIQKLYYKLAPSAMGSASSVEGEEAKAKMISSGMYARCSATSELWMTLGTPLTVDARTFVSPDQMWDHVHYVSSEDDCKKKCDASNVCWGFIMQSYGLYNKQCLYKGGEDALSTRSFFVVPTAVDLSPMNWQGASALDLAVGDIMSLAVSQEAQVTRQQIVDALNAVFAEIGSYDTVLASMSLGLGS